MLFAATCTICGLAEPPVKLPKRLFESKEGRSFKVIVPTVRAPSVSNSKEPPESIFTEIVSDVISIPFPAVIAVPNKLYPVASATDPL